MGTAVVGELSYVTDDVSSEVAVSVDREGLLPAVLVLHDGSEVIGEDLGVGPQVEPERSALRNTTRWMSAFTCEQSVRRVEADLCSAVKLSSFSTWLWLWTSRRRTEWVWRLEKGRTSKSSNMERRRSAGDKKNATFEQLEPSSPSETRVEGSDTTGTLQLWFD